LDVGGKEMERNSWTKGKRRTQREKEFYATLLRGLIFEKS